MVWCRLWLPNIQSNNHSTVELKRGTCFNIVNLQKTIKKLLNSTHHSVMILFAVFLLTTGVVFAQTSGVPSVKFEAEQGTSLSNASVDTDSAASGNSYLVFSASTTPPPPTEVQFLETFTGNTGLENFRYGVFQRNVDIHGYSGASGGTWQGDHGNPCTPPSYTLEGLRTLQWEPNYTMAQRRANSFYQCADHMMTSMGDVDGYSLTWFTPNRTFTNVRRVCWDVNLTYMGNRQWWKVGIVPTGEKELWSDVPAADLGDHGPNTVVMQWNAPAALRQVIVNNRVIGDLYDNGTNKATRFQNCMTDNGNNTITATQDRSTGRLTATVPGSFPKGTVTVMFHDHDYTPNKSEIPFQRPAYTFHWDNISVQ